MSLGQLCNDVFAVNFDANHVYLQKVRLLLIFNRDTFSGLFYTYFDPPIHPPHINNPTALSRPTNHHK